MPGLSSRSCIRYRPSSTTRIAATALSNRSPDIPTRRFGTASSSLNDRPIPVTGVPGFGKHLEPPFGVIVELGGQNPAFEYLFLLRRSITVHDHKRLSARDALDFRECPDRPQTGKIMDRVQGQNAVEGSIRKRQFFGGTQMKTSDHFLRSMHDGV